jgi:hypothetical protein
MPLTAEEIKRLSQGIAVAAVGVGSLIVGKRYYESYIINKWLNNTQKEIKHRYENCFTIDRLIDSDCSGKILTIGVNSNINPNNVLSHQGIRLGQDGDIKRLISFIKADNSLVYNFEDNTILTLTKNNTTNRITYSFEMPGKKVVKEMDDRIVSMYKTIGMASSELDKIVELK